jgi:hypothetical protein
MMVVNGNGPKALPGSEFQFFNTGGKWKWPHAVVLVIWLARPCRFAGAVDLLLLNTEVTR